MDGYLHYVKTLRSQINGASLSLSKIPYYLVIDSNIYIYICDTFDWNGVDVEDQAAKISVEEQMRITAIHTLETDLVSGSPFFLCIESLIVILEVLNYLAIFLELCS